VQHATLSNQFAMAITLAQAIAQGTAQTRTGGCSQQNQRQHGQCARLAQGNALGAALNTNRA
jgi:hypothetical protein